jgi:hypothetical protein
MRALRVPATPEEVKAVWESQCNPTAQSVAQALRQVGKKISAKKVAQWKALDWDPIIPPRHPVDAAMDALDAVVRLLTGDPTSTARSILRMQETAAELDTLSEEELLKRRTRALCKVGIVVAFELARRTNEFYPGRIVEFSLAHKTVSDALGVTIKSYKAELQLD